MPYKLAFSYTVAFGAGLDCYPGDPKPLMTLQSPEKVSIQIALHQRLQKRK